MRCVYCRASAGLMRRVCGTCAKVVAIIERGGASVGPGALVDIFKAEGLTREQVNRVLDAQIGSEPTVRDRLTANMTNALMRGLGMPGRQSPSDVKRVRLAMQAGDGERAGASGEKPRFGVD
jgi:hypothetical protein